MGAQNAAIVRSAVETVWNKGQLDVADSLFTATYVNHGGLIPDLVRGPEAIKLSVAFFRAAFPNLAIQLDSVSADRDTVEIEWVAHTADHTSVDHRSKPSWELTGSTIAAFSDGKISETWTRWDRAGALYHG